MNDSVFDLLAFIDASPTPYHAVREAGARLRQAGFTELDEQSEWKLEPGALHYAIRDDGSIAAFAVGSRPPAESGLRLVGAHTDSPNLRLKPKPELSRSGYRQLAVEPYGGVLLYTWLDRDLSVAGRVAIEREGRVRTVLVDLERPVLNIPSLAIHLQREIHETGLKLNAQEHVAPLLGPGEDPALFELLGEAASAAAGRRVTTDEILSFDLMTYDVRPSALGGVGDSLVFAPRLDNLASCHAALCGLLASVAAGPSAATRGVVFYDHEEVGSRSARGADGTLLLDLVTRLGAVGCSGEQALARTVTRSMLVSADMAHAVHPNFADRHEPSHRPVLGGGPVIKRNSNQAYATDARTAGVFAAACKRREVQPQHFVVRSDLPCGSTIGPITAARVGLPTVDVGNPMLAMHSCRETAGAADVQPMIDVLTEFFAVEELV